MKKKILLASVLILLIVDIIITATIGLRVSTEYAEGYLIKFHEKSTISTDDIKSIAKEIWGKNYKVQKVEFFDDSAVIKVRSYDSDQIETLKNKLNEKYSSNLETSDFEIEHIANSKIRYLVEPYILPIGLSVLFVLVYYTIRFKGAKEMIELLVNLLAVGFVLYTIHAICRLPVSPFSISFVIIAVILTILFTTFKFEKDAKTLEA